MHVQVVVYVLCKLGWKNGSFEVNTFVSLRGSLISAILASDYTLPYFEAVYRNSPRIE